MTDQESWESAARQVLVVDDEDAIRSALRRFLTRRGWSVAEAADGTRALDLLLDPVAEALYTAVLCDVILPGASGMQIYHRVRQERPELLPRMVFTSGDLDAPEAREIREGSSCLVVEKPFELLEILALLERAAGG